MMRRIGCQVDKPGEREGSSVFDQVPPNYKCSPVLTKVPGTRKMARRIRRPGKQTLLPPAESPAGQTDKKTHVIALPTMRSFNLGHLARLAK